MFPKIKSDYIDTGKIRYVFREFPLDIKAAAGSMLARCIAKDDAGEVFRRHRPAVQAAERLGDEGHHRDAEADRQAGRPQPNRRSKTCLKDQALLDKIAADQKYANEVLKVNSTPTFFINGEMLKGDTSLRGIRQAHQAAAEELSFHSLKVIARRTPFSAPLVGRVARRARSARRDGWGYREH